MNPKRKNKRKKPFRSSKRNCHHERAGRLLAGGAGMGADSELHSIIGIMLKDIVDQGGTISLNVEDGHLSISGETSGIALCDVTDTEAKQ